MNQFIKQLIPILFLIMVYIILFLDQNNNPYNKILKLDLESSKNTFRADDLMPLPILKYKLDKRIFINNNEYVLDSSISKDSQFQQNRRHGKITNPTFVNIIGAQNYKNRPDKALKFNGEVNDYIDISLNPPNKETDLLSTKNWKGFSFAGWIVWKFNSDNTPPHWSRIFDFGETSNKNNILLANRSKTKHLNFQFRNGGWDDGGDDIQVDNYIEDGKWIHVAVTFNNDNSRARIYKNGEFIKEKTMTKSDGTPLKLEFNNRQRSYIGKSNWPANDPNFKGQMSNLYFFDQELLKDHVKNLFNGDYNNDYQSDTSIFDVENNSNNSNNLIDQDIKETPLDEIEISQKWIRFFKIK